MSALAVNLRTLAAATASGTGDTVDLASNTYPLRRCAQLELVVSAAGGTTKTLTVTLQTSTDEAAWRSVASFTAATDVTTETLWFGPLDRYVRIVWTIAGTGTPTFTFGVAGVADELYSTPGELAQWGLPAAVLASVATTHQIAQLAAATQEARGFLLGHFAEPFSAVGADVRKAVCRIAVEGVYTNNTGINPNPEATALVIKAADDARSWLRQVSLGRAVANVTDSTATTYEGSGWAATANESRRGWGDSGVQ